MNHSLAQKIFGILNITEDSFFDGGKYFSAKIACEKAKQLIAQGAGVLDLGAAASHPDSKNVSAQQEITRLKPLIKYCKNQRVKISIDSCLSEVQNYAMEQEVDFLNDITGFSDSSIYEKIANHSCKIIVMHSSQRAAKADKKKYSLDIFPQIIDFFGERITTLIAAGIDRNRIILDTGMGFFLSSDPQVSFYVLKNIDTIQRVFELPLLLGVSRKSFLQKTIQKSANEIGACGAYLEDLLLKRGVNYIRTHSPHYLQEFALLKKKIS